jgi:hypothetical protein
MAPVSNQTSAEFIATRDALVILSKEGEGTEGRSVSTGGEWAECEEANHG